jgi:hypothetical protein
MSFRPIYGPLGGPGDLALGIAQGEAEAARIASQRPSSPGLAALGTGLGAGFSRGIESALEQQMFQERQAQRLAAQQQMQAARDQDALLRQQQRDAARLEREQEKRVFDELSQQAVQGEEILNNAFMSGRMSPADAQAYQEMQTDWAAMAGDGFIYMDPDEQQGYILQRNLSLTKMAQKYRPKSLLDKTLQTSIPGKSLNDRWEAEHGYRPFDESASYQYENRAGGSVLKPVDGTTALDRAKAEAELAKAKGDTGTNYLPLEGTPYAGLAPAGSFGEFKGDQFTGKILKAGEAAAGGLPISQDPEKMLKFHKAAQDQLKIEYGDRPIPDGAIPKRAQQLADMASQVGERSQEREAVNDLMLDDPINASAIKHYYDMAMKLARQKGLPPEVVVSNEIRMIMDEPGSNQSPEMVRRVELLRKIAGKLNAID